ncbi:MAG: glycosyltransferase [Eubacteriales bacterium]
MKIYCLESHPVFAYSLPKGLESLGHEVKYSGNIELEKLVKTIKTFKPDLLLMLGWSKEHRKNKLKIVSACRQYFNIPIVYWATEDPTHMPYFTLPLIKILKPSYVFSICKDSVEKYRKIGILSSHLDFGYEPSVFYTKPEMEKKYDITLVANAYPELFNSNKNHFRKNSFNQLIIPILEKGLRIDFFGRKWEDLSEVLELDIPKEWIHGYIPLLELNDIYNKSKIILGLQNHKTQVTQRTYEVLGAGGFFITNNTLAVNEHFKPGEHLITVNDESEVIKKVEYYLTNDQEREIIKKKGNLEVENHTYKERAKVFIDLLEKNNII